MRRIREAKIPFANFLLRGLGWTKEVAKETENAWDVKAPWRT
jgi:hypothetical protein